MSWHVKIIAAKLTAVRYGSIRRLIVNLPPRHLKSLLASVAFPAWCLGHDPSAQLLCVSYAQDPADKLSRDCRHILASDWYRGAFRPVSHRSVRESEFVPNAMAITCRASNGLAPGRKSSINVNIQLIAIGSLSCRYLLCQPRRTGDPGLLHARAICITLREDDQPDFEPAQSRVPGIGRLDLSCGRSI
jgi:hypothetical protein